MKQYYVLLILFFCFSILAQGNTVEKVSALLYLDKTPVTIEMKDGIIKRIIRNNKSDNSELFVAPGLIDIQINGYAAVDFSGENLSIDGIRKVALALWKEGITTFFPTIITNSDERISQNFTILAQAIEQEDIGLSIPGFHLEGPYISAEDGYRGAHLKEWVREPDINELQKYLDASQNNIIYLTLAPEIPGALEMIEFCVSQGIRIGIGHTGASAQQITAAADAGATISTHLGNGCANLIHRHDNPLWPQLADDRLLPSLIVDGFHLRHEEVKTFVKVKGADNIFLISDALDLAGMPAGEYWAGGKKVVMTKEGMLKYPEQNVLAGASMPVRRGVENMIKFTQCSLPEAIHMASKNPAHHFTLQNRGEILPGKRADLILFEFKDGEIKIKKTVLAGKVVYQDQN